MDSLQSELDPNGLFTVQLRQKIKHIVSQTIGTRGYRQRRNIVRRDSFGKNPTQIPNIGVGIGKRLKIRYKFFAVGFFTYPLPALSDRLRNSLALLQILPNRRRCKKCSRVPRLFRRGWDRSFRRQGTTCRLSHQKFFLNIRLRNNNTFLTMQ